MFALQLYIMFLSLQDGQIQHELSLSLSLSLLIGMWWMIDNHIVSHSDFRIIFELLDQRMTVFMHQCGVRFPIELWFNK